MTTPMSRTCDPGAARPAPRPDRGGFTLLELLLAIGVMGLVLGLGLPRLGAVKESFLAVEEAREVAALVRTARLDAVANRAAVTVAVAADGGALELRRARPGTWTVGGDQAVAADGDPQEPWQGAALRRVAVSGRLDLVTPGPGILFHANGTSSGGELLLCGGDGRLRHRILVDAGTGQVHVQQERLP